MNSKDTFTSKNKPHEHNLQTPPSGYLCKDTFVDETVQLKAFFHDKEDGPNTSNNDTFETLQIRKSKWTPPEGQFTSLDFFIKKCHHDINKLNFSRSTKFSNLSSGEWSALKSL